MQVFGDRWNVQNCWWMKRTKLAEKLASQVQVFLRSLLNYMLHVPSCLTCLTRLMCLTCLHALRVLLTRLLYTSCAPYLRILHALFVCLKTFLGWICSPSKAFHFPRTVKGTANHAVFMWNKKIAMKLFKWGSF